MIETFFNSTATNTRRTTASPTGSDTITTVSTFACLIRPITDVSKLYVANNIGKEMDLVTDNLVDLRAGDDIYINGVKYDTLGQPSIYEDLENDADSYLSARIVK